jgi:hypothetical protein
MELHRQNWKPLASDADFSKDNVPRRERKRIFRFFLVKLMKARRMLASNRQSQSKFMPVLHGPQSNNTCLAYPPTDLLSSKQGHLNRQIAVFRSVLARGIVQFAGDAEPENGSNQLNYVAKL